MPKSAVMPPTGTSPLTDRHRAFVAGATGLTGRALVEELAGRGIETIAHVRQDQGQLDEWLEWFRTQGSQVDVTAWEQIDISSTLARLKPSLVFCLLGSNPTRMRRTGAHKFNPFVDGYDAVDYGYSTMLMRASSSCGSNPRFVLVSAQGASEQAPAGLLRAKGKAEWFLASSSLRYTVVRVATILGTPLEQRRRGRRDRFLARYGLAREQWDVTPADLAKVLADAALDPAAVDTTFDPADYIGA